jgi:hypothetical protein
LIIFVSLVETLVGVFARLELEAHVFDDDGLEAGGQQLL